MSDIKTKQDRADTPLRREQVAWHSKDEVEAYLEASERRIAEQGQTIARLRETVDGQMADICVANDRLLTAGLEKVGIDKGQSGLAALRATNEELRQKVVELRHMDIGLQKLVTELGNDKSGLANRMVLGAEQAKELRQKVADAENWLRNNLLQTRIVGAEEAWEIVADWRSSPAARDTEHADGNDNNQPRSKTT